MPESLTIHTLALKRASLLRLWETPLPDGEETARMVQKGAEAARAMGQKPYYLYRQKYMAGNQENVGYALPGHECLYNVDIMEETESILAVGAGAISKRVFGGEGRIERAPNVSNVDVYIERLQDMRNRKKELWRP
jgi:oxygen-independent coproporphyrinogen-3 oxidase